MIMPHIQREFKVFLKLLSDPELKLIWSMYERTFPELEIDVLYCGSGNFNVLLQKETRNN